MRLFSKADCGVPATPEEQKEHLLKMMIAFDQFCKENNLRYYLSGGTLLGAIRHKGFIPWDDDVDVNMPRPDCERMQEICGGKIGGYTLNAPNCTQQYHAYHWKLYDDSMMIEVHKKNGYSYYPIFMDIFPIEGLPADDRENTRHYDHILRWKRFANCGWANVFHGRTIPKKLFHAIGRPFVKMVGKEKIFEKVISIAKEIPYEDSEYIGVMMTFVHRMEERVVKKEYEPQIKVMFEGHEFMAPAGYDPYLTQLYGDYMQLPPKEEQIPRHGFTLYHRNREEK